MSRESLYQTSLKRRIENMFPGCLILKNDPNGVQGIPDLLILWKDMWAALEVKRSLQDYLKNLQPNQEYYVHLMDAMSFADFIYPENEGEVLSALQQAFGSRRPARVSKRQQLALDKLRCRGLALPCLPTIRRSVLT
jgi:hypothetical protein